MRTSISSIEQKIVAGFLAMIRSRRTSLLNSELAATAQKYRKTAVKQREVQFSDFEGVAKLRERWGLSKDSLQNWCRLWRDNQALGFAKSSVSMGWVLEAEGQIVGYQGSVPLLYYYRGRPLLAAVGTGMVIEPAYRPFGMALLASFYRQENVGLFLITTAIDSVGKLTKALGAQPLPQADYDTVLFWIFNARRFATALSKKLGLNGPLGQLISFVGSPVIEAQMTLCQRRPRDSASRYRVAELLLSDIGDEFDRLWQRKLAEKPLLLADRSAASLRWHFMVPASQRRTTVLYCPRGRHITGYAILQDMADRVSGLRRCSLADVLVEGDDPDIIESLLRAAYEYAKSAGSDTFEVLGFPPQVRDILSCWRPYQRKYPAFPFFYKTRDRCLHDDLIAGAVDWYASPYDGDTSLTQ